MKELENEGVKEFTQLQAREYTIKAEAALDKVNPEPDARSALKELATELLERDN